MDSKIIFPNKNESEALLGTSDDYTQELSIFDIKAKTENLNASNETDYLNHAKNQVMQWTEQEKATIKESITSAETKIKNLGLQLNLPNEIKILKSTGKEEGGAAYTRSDFIVLNSIYVQTTTAAESIFLHELFHVYSRANASKRDELYLLIGFKKSNKNPISSNTCK